jgi:hypothetical protein
MERFTCNAHRELNSGSIQIQPDNARNKTKVRTRLSEPRIKYLFTTGACLVDATQCRVKPLERHYKVVVTGPQRGLGKRSVSGTNSPADAEGEELAEPLMRNDCLGETDR